MSADHTCACLLVASHSSVSNALIGPDQNRYARQCVSVFLKGPTRTWTWQISSYQTARGRPIDAYPSVPSRCFAMLPVPIKMTTARGLHCILVRRCTSHASRQQQQQHHHQQWPNCGALLRRAGEPVCIPQRRQQRSFQPCSARGSVQPVYVP